MPRASVLEVGLIRRVYGTGATTILCVMPMSPTVAAALPWICERLEEVRPDKHASRQWVSADAVSQSRHALAHEIFNIWVWPRV